MAVRANPHVGRDVVARARVRMPGLVPDSVEVVELARGEAFVVVRSNTSRLVVLDLAGRLVRRRDTLNAIGRHLRALQQVGRAVDEAHLAQRRDHAERSLTLLADLAERCDARQASRVQAVTAALSSLQAALSAVSAQWGAGDVRPPTERTLRRTVVLLNEAASADRAVVRAVRELGAALPADAAVPQGQKLLRWVVARLASVDLPYFMEELAHADCDRFATGFARAARA